jgi:hypothetical protein
MVIGLARSRIEARRAIDAGGCVAARPGCAERRKTGTPAAAAVNDIRRRRLIIVEGYTTLTADVAELERRTKVLRYRSRKAFSLAQDGRET